MRTLRFLTATAIITSLTACDVDAELENLGNDLENTLIESAFDALRQTAEDNGGAAVLLAPGQEYELAVTDAESPLFGARVIIPTGALPADIERAAATIQTAGEPGATATDAVKAAGPFATIAIVGLPSLQAIDLQTDISITLPYAKDTAYPLNEFALGRFSSDGISAIDGSSVDQGTQTVAGETKDLDAAFAAAWRVDYKGGAVDPGAFAYKVTHDEDVLCVGRQDGFSAEGSTFIVAGGFGFSFSGGTGTTMLVESGQLLFDASATFPQPLPAGKFTVVCDGNTYTHDSVSGLNVVSWTESSSAGANCFGADDDCTEATGTVVVQGHVQYPGLNGETIKAGINVTIENFLWYY